MRQPLLSSHGLSLSHDLIQSITQVLEPSILDPLVISKISEDLVEATTISAALAPLTTVATLYLYLCSSALLEVLILNPSTNLFPWLAELEIEEIELTRDVIIRLVKSRTSIGDNDENAGCICWLKLENCTGLDSEMTIELGKYVQIEVVCDNLAPPNIPLA